MKILFDKCYETVQIKEKTTQKRHTKYIFNF